MMQCGSDIYQLAAEHTAAVRMKYAAVVVIFMNAEILLFPKVIDLEADAR